MFPISEFIILLHLLYCNIFIHLCVQLGAEDAGAGGGAVHVGASARARGERPRARARRPRARLAAAGGARPREPLGPQAERAAARALGPRAAARAAALRPPALSLLLGRVLATGSLYWRIDHF